MNTPAFVIKARTYTIEFPEPVEATGSTSGLRTQTVFAHRAEIRIYPDGRGQVSFTGATKNQSGKPSKNRAIVQLELMPEGSRALGVLDPAPPWVAALVEEVMSR